MKYMIARGRQTGALRVEIVDVRNPTKSCVLYDDLTVYSVIFSSGGLLGTTPVICGGYRYPNYLDECLLFGTSQVITMNSQRMGHSSVGLNNSSMFWIIGGRDENHILDSTEYVTTEGAVNGPTLPEPLEDHCSVHFTGNGLVYLISGTTPFSLTTNKVWMANLSNEFTFAQGPSIIQARYGHSCGSMSIGNKSIIVAAGGMVGSSTNYKYYLRTVEILDPLSHQWVAGN